MPGFIGTTELLFLGILALLLLGPRRLPELGRSLGAGIREFQGSIRGAGERDVADKPDPSIVTINDDAAA